MADWNQPPDEERRMTPTGSGEQNQSSSSPVYGEAEPIAQPQTFTLRLPLSKPRAVWVLLESGNAEADAKALQTLERELPRLQTTLEVPQVAEEAGLELGDIQTEISFAIVRVRRDDPKENIFVRMLLGVEPDLKDFKDKPLVFPVYGRGRVMYAMVGEGINPRTIAAAGEFLVGPCSCQIKEDNPGVDLLLPIDWHAKVKRRTRLAVPGGAGAQDFLKRLDQLDKELDK